MKTYYSLCLLSALLTIPGLALSHGKKKHDAGEATTVERIQKPWGIAAVADDVTQTVEITMGDNMRFEPSTLEFSVGETVRFTVSNEGKLLHEFVLGTTETNDEHAELMIKFPNMEHDEPYMAHVDPGEVGEIIWTFNKPGEFDFACLIAGHYQAGMVGSITVSNP